MSFTRQIVALDVEAGDTVIYAGRTVALVEEAFSNAQGLRVLILAHGKTWTCAAEELVTVVEPAQASQTSAAGG